MRWEQRRTLALQLALDSSLLRQKELEQLEQLHQHRLQEMADSRSFRSQGLLPQTPEPEQPSELDRLLGLTPE